MEIAFEKEAEVERFLDRVSKDKSVDLESWEFGLRRAVLAVGAQLLEEMIDGLGSGRQDKPINCACGSKMGSSGRKKKRIKTLLGDITVKRSIFVCPACGNSRVPADELLDVVKTGFSPGTRKLMARAGQRDTIRPLPKILPSSPPPRFFHKSVPSDAARQYRWPSSLIANTRSRQAAGAKRTGV